MQKPSWLKGIILLVFFSPGVASGMVVFIKVWRRLFGIDVNISGDYGASAGPMFKTFFE